MESYRDPDSKALVFQPSAESEAVDLLKSLIAYLEESKRKHDMIVSMLSTITEVLIQTMTTNDDNPEVEYRRHQLDNCKYTLECWKRAM